MGIMLVFPSTCWCRDKVSRSLHRVSIQQMPANMRKGRPSERFFICVHRDYKEGRKPKTILKNLTAHKLFNSEMMTSELHTGSPVIFLEIIAVC